MELVPAARQVPQALEEILEVDEDRQRVLVTFFDWGDEWNEFLPMASDRIARPTPVGIFQGKAQNAGSWKVPAHSARARTNLRPPTTPAAFRHARARDQTRVSHPDSKIQCHSTVTH